MYILMCIYIYRIHILMYIYTHVAAGAEGNFVEFLWSEPEIFDQGGKSSAGGESSCQTRSVARLKGELRGGRFAASD